MAVTANKHRPRGARTALALPALLALAFAPAALAIDWRFEPNVRGSAIYTDNVNSSATDPQDALILT
ncbi:MAG: TIGR03016 family PEP-CTERM system-associated outer membrane protein, partial [Thiobacillus sp.]|nr:TIGR03016 family PEP-CTERM system-associated outer membrane protein [Thiobacillus sp.]